MATDRFWQSSRTKFLANEGQVYIYNLSKKHDHASKFIYTGKAFEGTLTIFENHGRLSSMPNPTTIL